MNSWNSWNSEENGVTRKLRLDYSMNTVSILCYGTLIVTKMWQIVYYYIIVSNLFNVFVTITPLLSFNEIMLFGVTINLGLR